MKHGNYIEKIFPSKNVRYIAVNDNVDTFDKRNSNNDMTPFKAVINDMYAKDTSNKVRSTILTKAINGECIKAFLPYGYKKDASNKNKILVDENVANNVKMIFDLYKSGYSKTEIAKKLNELEIETPLKYKQANTNYYNPNANVTYKWNSTVINKILRNKIYIGDLVQMQYTKVNYKIKKIVKVAKDEQVVIQNNHEAIIDKNTFNTVQEMLDKKTNEWNYSTRKKHLLTGLVFCKCGSRITYNKNHGKVSRCICSSYKKYGNKFCASIHLKESELIDIAKYEKQQKQLNSEISLLSKEKENVEEFNPKQLVETMKNLLEFDTINKENKSLVFKLIDKIIIDDDKINISYKFNNIEL